MDRPSVPLLKSEPSPAIDLLSRHKSSIVLNLKSFSALVLLQSLLRKVDVLIDPYRPGILESLGLDPTTLLQENPRLIVARLTGFRRSGKYAQMAGHDINYLAVNGVLSQLGLAGQPPYPPANILADFAGGGLMCALGILFALISRQQTGRGQIVEANMVDGSGYLATFMRLALHTSLWDRPRGENVLDGGCPWYTVYECKDGRHMAVGALEPRFFKLLLDGLGLGSEWAQKREDRSVWPHMKRLMQNRFLEKTREDWEHIFDGKDACCTPVLEQSELELSDYEQQPAVGLTKSPGLAISRDEAYSHQLLVPGAGGNDVLRKWMGWTLGKDFIMENGGLVKIESAKL